MRKLDLSKVHSDFAGVLLDLGVLVVIIVLLVLIALHLPQNAATG